MIASLPARLSEPASENVIAAWSAVSDAAPRLESAERGLMLAEQTGKPVLFVLHDEQENSRFYEQWRRRMGPHLGARASLGAPERLSGREPASTASPQSR